MKRLILILCCILACIVSHAQWTSSLTLTSEGGHRFYVFLNGQMVNTRPESSIKIRELPEKEYFLKIVFESNIFNDIKVDRLSVAADKSKVSQALIYKIAGRSAGRQKLELVSATAMDGEVALQVAPGAVVYDFGTQIPAPSTASGGQTIPADKKQPNAPIRDTTISVKANLIPDTQCTQPMTNPDYQAAKAAMNTTAYDDPKLKAAKAIAASHCLTAKQIADLCMLFDFEEPKLIFAKYAYAHCYDKPNYTKVVNILRTDPNKAVLNYFIMKDYPIPVTIIK